MTIEQLYSIYLAHPSVQTDTRKLQKGDIFFALKGPNFNANTFVQLALDQGASYVITDGEVINTEDQRIIKVEEVLNTLQQLAKHHRLQFGKHPDGQPIPFLAITGTNGKTTTKELISVVLSSKFRTYTTQGNLNNHIGIPLTLLSIRADAEMAVIEMGASHQPTNTSNCCGSPLTTLAIDSYAVLSKWGHPWCRGSSIPPRWLVGASRTRGSIFRAIPAR